MSNTNKSAKQSCRIIRGGMRFPTLDAVTSVSWDPLAYMHRAADRCSSQLSHPESKSQRSGKHMITLFNRNFESYLYNGMRLFLPAFRGIQVASTITCSTGSSDSDSIDNTRFYIRSNFHLLRSSSTATKEKIMRYMFKRGVKHTSNYRRFESMIESMQRKEEDKERYMAVVIAAIQMADVLVSSPELREDPDVVYQIGCMTAEMTCLMRMHQNPSRIHHQEFSGHM